jgi:hypothetical protein
MKPAPLSVKIIHCIIAQTFTIFGMHLDENVKKS